MPVNLVSDEELRAVLRRDRVDPQTFEAGVRKRMEEARRERANDPLVGLSPFLRNAAAFLPLTVLSGCAVAPTATKLAPTGGVYKLLGYLTFPAISLFVLFGAAMMSVFTIRSIRSVQGGGTNSPETLPQASLDWWKRHQWGAGGVFAVSLGLGFVGATWLLFLFYIVSFGILVYVLSSLAKRGLGNRQVVGSSCMMGLMFLGQVAGFSGIGDSEIHFLDQLLIVAVFLGGGVVLLLLIMVLSPPVGLPSRRIGAGPQWIMATLVFCAIVPLAVWLVMPTVWPATPTQIKQHVESFHHARFQTASWQEWEIVASWVVQSKLDPDLSKPRALLVKELSDGQNPFILGNALRVGLMSADQLDQLKDYTKKRQSLIGGPFYDMEPQQITSLEQCDWVIRVAVLRNDLTLQERDRLEQRLLATLEALSKSPFDEYDVLVRALRVTQLLELIQRPIDRDQYRDQVHNWLRKFHCLNGGGFQRAGGFKKYLAVSGSSMDATAYAVELMEIYGVPADLDLNWVRSYLRPSRYSANEKWMAAVTRERLNHLPGVTPPTWLEFLCYERTLLAATVLVGLCFYATLCSPTLKVTDLSQEPLP